MDNLQPNPYARLITTAQYEQLIANGRASRSHGHDPLPVVKLFTPDAQATWLLSEIDPDEPDVAFGLCDLGLGCPELGYVSLSEIANLRGRLRLPVERDLYFRPTKSISDYADEAHRHERIIA